MSVRLYNSLTRRIDDFVPIRKDAVNMFVCGPTVYDRIHIGNARTFTVFDVIAKWLRYRKFDVNFIQNITDIDDRIIVRAAEQHRDPLEFAHEFDDRFREDMALLGNDAVSQYARATDHIDQVRSQVTTLITKGHVYLIEGDGWYFDLSSFPDYGKLSGRTGVQADDAVTRIDESVDKKNRGDFCVWKLSKPGEPVWDDAALGAGRPGWHIEDTAITEHYFGPQYDLHGGGIDLKFPHHEAEVAQQEAASGKVPFVRYWMHAGFLTVNEERMGKSKGNFERLHDLLASYEPAVLRFFLLSNHYRAPLDFSGKSLVAAQAAYQRIREMRNKAALAQLHEASKDGSLIEIADRTIEKAEEAMDDDFNTPRAFAALFEFITAANSAFSNEIIGGRDIPAIVKVLNFYDVQFGIIPHDTDYSGIPEHIRRLVDERETARAQKDWATADHIRGATGEAGYIIDDTPYGPLVKKK